MAPYFLQYSKNWAGMQAAPEGGHNAEMAMSPIYPAGPGNRMARIARAVGATLTALAPLSPAHADEGVVDLRQPAAQGAAIQVRLHAQRRMARNASAVGGSSGRRIGLVRFARRAGADQSPRRRGLPAVALDRGQRSRRQRFLRAHAQPRSAPAPGMELRRLESMEDATAKVRAAVKSSSDDGRPTPSATSPSPRSRTRAGRAPACVARW